MNNDSYMQAPKVLWNPDSRYFLLSNNAKIIYMLMIDRYKLSAKSHQEGNSTWFDVAKNRCFVKFSNTELGKLLGGISSKTIIKAKLELEELGLIKQFAKENDRSCYFFVFPPKEAEDIVEEKQEEKKEKVDIILPTMPAIVKNEVVNAEDIIFGQNVIQLSAFERRWRTKKGCKICERLVKVLDRFDDKELINDEEFWYLRNSIQSYEQNNMIGNLKAFVETLRKKFQENKDFISVKVGADTDIDIKEAILNSIQNTKDLDLIEN